MKRRNGKRQKKKRVENTTVHAEISGLRFVGFPNVLVLSAGGFGHVPIPLVKQTEPVANVSRTETNGKFSHTEKQDPAFP